MKPLIGVTTAVSTSAYGVKVSSAYTAIISALERAGALPVLIPSNISDDTLHGIYERLDGLMLPGGGDIDAHYFNEAPHPKSDTPDPDRDHAEVTLVRRAIADDLPVFGICRGHQVINVAMGGSLIQDIPSAFGENPHEQHIFAPGSPLAMRRERSHTITLTEDTSRLATILGTTQLPVNSIHHQAVKDVAPGFVVTAQSPDGVIEALEMPGKRFALSVQWHPEDLADEDHQMQAIFDAFVAACIAAHESRRQQVTP